MGTLLRDLLLRFGVHGALGLRLRVWVVGLAGGGVWDLVFGCEGW